VQWTLDRAIAEAAGTDNVPDSLRKELEQRYRQGVENSLRRMVLLAAVARQEKLAVSETEVAAEIQRMMESEPRLASRVRARYQSEERRQALRESLLERKALDWLVDAAEIREENQAATPLVVPAGR
jgi:trigger factor